MIDIHVVITLPLVILLLTSPSARGGICWSAMERHGRCTELLQEQITKEDCCSPSNGVATAWSSEDLDAGTLFFWRALGGGVPCHPCKETCSGVECGPGKKCVMRKGLPKCVCFPHCRAHKRAYKGPVCGTDGRTYRSLCKLRKRACRKDNAALAVAYQGMCQSTCDRVRCPAGKYCLLDQNLTPHCVRCSRRCSPQNSRPVCGVDHRTYPSACHIRQAACRRGKAVPVAYKGKCIPSASCKDIHCSHGQRCLTEWRDNSPRCVSCSSIPCPDPVKHHTPEICGSNNRTYSSWCLMIKDACATGYVIETQASGYCLSGKTLVCQLLLNTILLRYVAVTTGLTPPGAS